jgi:uncharacterized repeat protein (TIGR03803 family)
MKTMTTNRNTMLAVLCTLLLGAANAPAQFNLLHKFTFNEDDGSYPYGAPTVSGSTLYGTTFLGGTHDRGTVFKMNTDGNGFTLLYSFTGLNGDGRRPYGSLTLDGSTLYGMTYGGGGPSGYGTVFKMNTNGTEYTVLHPFTGSDGSNPNGSLTLSGSTLYGMTSSGGNNFGTVFKMNTDGTGFEVLHPFTGSDGQYPNGSLTLSGSTLYGMTYGGGGGTNALGTVFQMNTNGAGFATLHTFTGSVNDGRNPYGSLTLSGSTLYGMTSQGGVTNAGTVFKMNTDGTGFELLRSFTGGGSDGRSPMGDLTLDGSTLYGMTQYGGSNDAGTAFQMNTNGTGFALLRSFAGGDSDGMRPFGSLTLDSSTLYGMTVYGGDRGNGTVFSIGVVPEPSSMGLVLLGVGLIGWRRLRLRRES